MLFLKFASVHAEMLIGNDPTMSNIQLKLFLSVQCFFNFCCSLFPERMLSHVTAIKRIYVSERLLLRDKLNFYFKLVKWKHNSFIMH